MAQASPPRLQARADAALANPRAFGARGRKGQTRLTERGGGAGRGRLERHLLHVERRLAHAVERVATVTGVGPHLRRPTPGFDRLCPSRTGEDVRTIDLIDRRIARTLVAQPLFFPADADRERLPCEAGDGVHTRHLE